MRRKTNRRRKRLTGRILLKSHISGVGLSIYVSVRRENVYDAFVLYYVYACLAGKSSRCLHFQEEARIGPEHAAVSSGQNVSLALSGIDRIVFSVEHLQGIDRNVTHIPIRIAGAAIDVIGTELDVSHELDRHSLIGTMAARDKPVVSADIKHTVGCIVLHAFQTRHVSRIQLLKPIRNAALGVSKLYQPVD
jgi:hypothetical protein